MYHTNNIKRAFIIISFWIAIFRIQAVQAMEEPKTLTEIAEKQENSTGFYISPQKLIYIGGNTTKNTVKKGQRIAHIKEHLTDNKNKKRHTYFNPGTAAHKDIIGFIDIIFEEFYNNNINLNSQNRSRNILLGEINLHNKKYKVIDNYDGVQHTYDIISSDKQDPSYPIIGTLSGSKYNGGSLYGYRITTNREENNSEIQSFFPF